MQPEASLQHCSRGSPTVLLQVWQADDEGRRWCSPSVLKGLDLAPRFLGTVSSFSFFTAFLTPFFTTGRNPQTSTGVSFSSSPVSPAGEDAHERMRIACHSRAPANSMPNASTAFTRSNMHIACLSAKGLERALYLQYWSRVITAKSLEALRRRVVPKREKLKIQNPG